MDNSNEKLEATNELPKSPDRKYWIIAGVAVIILALVLILKPKPGNESSTEPEKKESLYKRDEPAEQQIYQDDYKQKVMELIDSGKTVGEISRETGIRRDVIRRIKKEMGKNDE